MKMSAKIVLYLFALVATSSFASCEDISSQPNREGDESVKETANAVSSETELPGHGGSSWRAYQYTFNESYYGYRLRSGSYVDAFSPHYWDWETSSPADDYFYGGEGGELRPLAECSDPYGWLVGYYGRAGGFIDKLGFICSTSWGGLEYLPAYGGDGGDYFEDHCPPGQIITHCGVGHGEPYPQGGGDWLIHIQCDCQ